MTDINSKSLVSVIIPVYNGEKYLEQTLESALNQDYPQQEIIVVDDGSTDKTKKIIKKYPEIKYYCQQNQGTAAALNFGLKKAQGEFLSFLGADDFWPLNKTSLQIKAFRNDPNLDAVSGHVKQFLSPDVAEKMNNRIRFSEESLPGQIVSAMLTKREAFFRIGLFETQWQVGSEMGWILRASEGGLRTKVLKEIVYHRRIHDNNKGLTKKEFIQQRTHILKEALDRRRGIKK